jgi:3D-(3,5/4)-trihydroxycyclohexane-1,2-dione acylhydrolase (decyclizing)
MAEPDRDVICMIGDGSYMMANSELATAAMLGIKFTMVITDNRGFGCINRLQMATGGAEFNNLLKDSRGGDQSMIDFRAHAAAMGATAVKVANIAELEAALLRAKAAKGPFVAVIDTDPYPGTPVGGTWWEVAVPEVSVRPSVVDKHKSYVAHKKEQATT